MKNFLLIALLFVICSPARAQYDVVPLPQSVQIQDGEKRLHELADPLISPEHFNSVYETVLEANTVHRLYLGLIRKLGRGIGTQVYSAIKQEHEAIKSALSKAE